MSLLRSLWGGSGEGATPRAVSRPIYCPNRACKSPEHKIIGDTNLAWTDGAKVRVEAYGYRAVCLRCATIFAFNPQETYEIMGARTIGPVLATGDDLPDRSDRAGTGSLVGEMRRLGVPHE